MKEILNRYKIHLYILGLILLISAAFVPEAIKGKVLQQSDITHYKGAASEITQYRDNANERIIWTNSQFGGMPTYLISGLASKVPLIHLRQPKTPLTWEKIFLYLFCGYIMLISFGVRPWLALVGAIGIAFATENITIISVGHNTKSIAIAYLPLVVAGVQYLFKKRHLLGLALLSAGLGLQILSNHLQITYYGGILILIYFIFQLIAHIREKKLKDFFIASAFSVFGLILAVGANSLPLMLTNEYSAYTMRGDNELTLKKENGKVTEITSVNSGLPKSYTFSYSFGWTDVPALIIPNYSGGDSDKLGLYYGDIGSTSGPKYIGAGMFVLMVIGFFVLTGPIRWWLLSTILLTIPLTMGQNHFVWLNDFFYDYVPLYNKFRSPSMMIVLVQISGGILAMVGLEKLFSLPKNDPIVLKKIKYAGFGTLGVVIILTFFSSMFNDFNSNPKYDEVTGQIAYDSDTRYAQQLAERQGGKATQAQIDSFKSQLSESRIDLMKKDGQRSIFFMALIFLMVWLYYKGKIDVKYTILIIGILITLDMWTVGKRYMSDKDFKKKSRVANAVLPTETDRIIMQDKSHHRVLDLTVNPMNSSVPCYFHKNIGGYSAVKMRRYQDIWTWYLNDDLYNGRVNDNGLINMLNTKYIIYPNRQQQGSAPLYFVNQGALGNAWFVPDYKIVENADSAVVNLDGLDPQNMAIIEGKYESMITKVPTFDSSASIKLTNYHPEKMTYESNSSTGGLAIFSEIYYDKGWNAYIDNTEVEHVCANYILRGLQIPSGKHTVEFRFEPKTYALGSMLSNVFSGIIFLLIIAGLGLWVKSNFISSSEETSNK